MPTIVDKKGSRWTYGAEHELTDWDTQVLLPQGFGRSPDYTIANSNGIAAQPNPSVYRYGGEINTPPSDSPEGQTTFLEQILETHPNAGVNYRSNLHIHIRVPGLKESLTELKRLQKYIHAELPKYINQLEPIPKGITPAERKREKRRKVSHHTFLTTKRLQHQLTAETVQDFFEREVPRSKAGKIMWHAQPRLAVGLRQLLQTDTIEFRHFPGTIDARELEVAIQWCRDFLVAAFRGEPLGNVWERFRAAALLKFPTFSEELEIGYQATASHNGLPLSQVRSNIQAILKGEFYGSEEYRKAVERARGLSR